MSHLIWYRVPEVCPDSWYSLEQAWKASNTHPLMQEAMACACAKDYCAKHDGWECSWPQQIAVHELNDGPVMFTAIVERELKHQYSGRLIQSP